MPFKKNTATPNSSLMKSQQSSASPIPVASLSSNHFQFNESTNDKIQSTFILRSQSLLSQQNNNNNNNKSSNNLAIINNTDHLCTNFKRMIKLSDSNNTNNQMIESDTPISPLTAASNTPTFENTTTIAAADLFENNNTFSFSNFDCDSSNFIHEPSINNLIDGSFSLPINNDSDNNNILTTTTNTSEINGSSNSTNKTDQSSRFGQITMETRSTRKFLIKHHPYLQLNSNINNNSTNTNKLFNQQRPSINLIKMKKLISKSSNSNKMNETNLNDTNSRISGRNSRSNNNHNNNNNDNDVVVLVAVVVVMMMMMMI